MSDIKACRICLRTGVKMYHYDRFQLKLYYEEVIGIKVSLDTLPQQFCYECATLLHKFHKFRDKCNHGQHVLYNLLCHGPISYESLQSANIHTELTQYTPESLNINIDPSDITQDKDEFFEVLIDNKEIQKLEIDDNYLSEHSILDDLIDHETEEKLFVEENTVIIEQKDQKESTDYKDVNDDYTNNKSKKKKVKVKKEKDKQKICERNHAKFDEIINNGKWDVSSLSEEDALIVFNAKAESKKYLDAAFKCTHCLRGFSKKNMLDRHLQLRHVESLGPYDCSFCHQRFKLECYLKRHMREHYYKYKCLRCGLECHLQNSALLHEEYHSGITRKCPYCNEEFKHMSTFYSHLRTHKSEYVCTLCGVSFVSELGLKQHKHIKHIIANESSEDEEQGTTYCKRCDIRFQTRKAYDEHLYHSALHVEDNDSDNQPLVKSQTLIEKMIPTRKVQNAKSKNILNAKPPNDRRKTNRRMCRKPTTCHQCGAHFETQAACMKHHIKKHPRTSFFSSSDRYICEICGSSLAPGSIANHQNMHSREIIHTCVTCGRQFHAAMSLKRHLLPGSFSTHMNAHSREIMHECKTCGREFTEIASLKRHNLTHTGEKPFACSLCDKRFTQSNSMKLHYRTYHLKQPYPKRNRWKKKDDAKQKLPETSTEDDSVDSLSKPQQISKPDEMHFLTLT